MLFHRFIHHCSIILVLSVAQTCAQGWFFEWLYRYVRPEPNATASEQQRRPTMTSATSSSISTTSATTAATQLLPTTTTTTTTSTTVVPVSMPSGSKSQSEHKNSLPSDGQLKVVDRTIAANRSEVPNGKDCRRFDDHELFEMLENVGAYNQRFMANSLQDAARFPDLLPPEPSNDAVVPALATVKSQPILGVSPADIRPRNLNEVLTYSAAGCNTNCQLLEKKLALLLNEWNDNKSINLSRNESTSIKHRVFELNADSSEHIVSAATRRCKLETFFNVGQCDKRGSEADLKGYERLCTACRGVYKVSVGCFPQFFNAVQCDSSDGRCIYDWWKTAAHGKCQEQKLTFTVMRNVGTEECQQWEYTNLDVPIACECFLSKSSWLRSA